MGEKPREEAPEKIEKVDKTSKEIADETEKQAYEELDKRLEKSKKFEETIRTRPFTDKERDEFLNL